MITIDGSVGEGGGQVLRNALALSLVTGQPFRIENIRAGRERPGLMRQHVTAVEAACAVGGATCDELAVGASALTFVPGAVRGGTYRFAVGTAGSASLVLQAILPPLLLADGPSHVVVEGGTHNIQAPPFEFFAKCLVPLLNRMGPRVTANLGRHGFYPAGGGRIEVHIEPAAKLAPLELVQRGELLRTEAVAMVAGLPRDIGLRELEAVEKVLGWPESARRIEVLAQNVGPGNVLLLEAQFENVTEIATGFGQLGVAAQMIGEKAARRMAGYLDARAVVGPYLADQLLLPLALAGSGAFTTVKPTQHSRTAAEVIAKFVAVDISFTASEVGGYVARVS